MNAQPPFMFAEQEDEVKSYRPIAELVPTHWHEGDIFANGIRQHYYRTGNTKKSPLLLLHGFNSYGLGWLHVAKELEGDYDIIMPDARGHGHSEGIANGFSTRLLVEDLAALIQALKLDHPRILGLSQGGATVLHLAAEHPELVHSFIVEGWGVDRSPADLAKSEGFRAWSRQFYAWLQQLRTMSHEERLVAAMPYLLPVTGGKLWPEEEYVPAVEGYALFDLELAGDNSPVWTIAEQNNLTELLKRVTCPALIMQHSFAFPAPATQPTYREVPSEQPNIKIVYFENTGHLIHNVVFEQYMAMVRTFLQEH